MRLELRFNNWNVSELPLFTYEQKPLLNELGAGVILKRISLVSYSSRSTGVICVHPEPIWAEPVETSRNDENKVVARDKYCFFIADYFWETRSTLHGCDEISIRCLCDRGE